MDPLLELIDKINATGRSVLVVELQPPAPGEPLAPSQQAAYLVRSWTPPAPTSAALFITGQLLLPNELAAVLDRARAGGQSNLAEFEQALEGLRQYRRQYSPNHRWTLYDAHPNR